jgi:hypothetical protein
MRRSRLWLFWCFSLYLCVCALVVVVVVVVVVVIIMVFRLCVVMEELEQVPAAIDGNGNRKEDEKHEGAPVGYDPNRIQVLRLKKLPRVTIEREWVFTTSLY